MFLGLAFRDRIGIGEEGLTRMDDLGDIVVLGLESSCDETAAAVVRRRADGSGEILSNVVFSQIDLA